MNPTFFRGWAFLHCRHFSESFRFPRTLASMTFHQVTKYIKEQHERNKAVITSIIKIDIALTRRPQTLPAPFHMEM
jgi:hypothetical protein